MNVLQISCNNLGQGGVQQIIMNLKRHLNVSKMDVVVFDKNKMCYDDEFERLNGKIFRIPLRNGIYILRPFYKYYNLLKVYLKVSKILKNNKYDVIHCHNEYVSSVCLKAAYKMGVTKRITHFHRTDYNLNNRLIYKIYDKITKKMITKYSTDIICCTNETRKSFFLSNDKKIQIIHNFIDLKEFKNKKAENHKGLLNLTNIGQYCDNKNQLFLLRVAKLLKEQGILFHLNLIGFGDNYSAKIKEEINNLDIKKEISLIEGTRENIMLVLRNTDIFLFPSKNEGFGIVLLEAQAMNIKCIASDSVPRDSNVGLVKYLQINNPNIWANCIPKLLNESMKLDSEKLKKYDKEFFLKKIYEIYS